MKKGFTLVEVLAVIAILGLVIAISIPKVVSTMNDSNKKAFKIDAQLVLKTIDLKLAQGVDYDITTLTADTLKSVFGINNKNFKTVAVSYLDELPYISIEGKNEWEGLIAYGTQDEMSVTEADYVDSIAPVISLIGASQVYLEVGTMYYEVGATAIDNHDGDITNKITMQGNVVNTSVVGTYVLNYAVSDHVGNTSSVTRTVIVLANAAPTVAFGMNGNTTYAKTRSTSVTVSDNVAVNSSSLEYQWTTSATAPTEASFTTTFTNGSTLSTPAGVNGGYYLWILAKDTNNNTMIARSNVFNLDNTAPVITITGSSIVIITSGTTYTDAGATASDSLEGNLTSRITLTGTVDTTRTGDYSISYNVTDTAGNAASAKVRAVSVLVGRVEVLVVAGGGGGGANHAGGGGAGGVIYNSSYSVSTGSSYTVTVGAGGGKATAYTTINGYNGGNSVFDTLTAIGGGGGGNRRDTGTAGLEYGKAGGSGGGGGGQGTNDTPTSTGGSGTTGQGYAGGTASYHAGAGGGGAGGAGATTNGSIGAAAATTKPGNGGPGVQYSISGTPTWYAGGGGGGGYIGGPYAGTGGSGIGGNGQIDGTQRVDAIANTGSGGGGANGGGNANGGNGSSGIVIVRYYGVQRATGGTITSVGGYTIHTFTTSGSFVVSSS